MHSVGNMPRDLEAACTHSSTSCSQLHRKFLLGCDGLMSLFTCFAADDSAAAPRVQPPSAADTQLDRADMQPDAADAQPAAADVSDEDEGMEVLSQDGGDDSTAGDQDYMTREEEQADDEATLDEEEVRWC